MGMYLESWRRLRRLQNKLLLNASCGEKSKRQKRKLKKRNLKKRRQKKRKKHWKTWTVFPRTTRLNRVDWKLPVGLWNGVTVRSRGSIGLSFILSLAKN